MMPLNDQMLNRIQFGAQRNKNSFDIKVSAKVNKFSLLNLDSTE